VLPLNKKIILFIFLIVCSIFGQTGPKPTQIISFKEAVNKYNRGDYLETKYLLENLSPSEKSYFEQEIPLLLMKTEYRLSNYVDSKNIGKTFLRNSYNSEYEIDILMTFGDIFVAESKYNSAFRTYIDAYKLSNDRSYQNKIVKRILLILQFGISDEIIQELSIFENNNDILQILQLAKTHNFIKGGKQVAARKILDKINKNDLNGIGKDYYYQLEQHLGSEYSNIIIPVVLPLSGKNSKIGMEFLDGIKYAQSEFSSRRTKLSFIVHDNESDEVKTIEVFNKISSNPNNIAVLGPITQNNSIIAGSFSLQQDMPLILPNSCIDELADISNDIFLMNSDLKTRGELAAKFIAEQLDAETIAVLAPADKFGKNIVDAFQAELAKYKKTPIVMEWYSGVPINLEHQFKSFRNTAWEMTDSTSQFETSIDSILVLYKFEEEMTEEDSADVILTAIDAIYMPIKEGHLDYVGAQFPAYNLEATVVGNENWTDMNVLRKESIGPHFRGLTVISNYNHCQIDQLNNNLGKIHTEYFYQGIDAYKILVEAVNISQNSNIPLKNAISEIYNYSGIYGTYNFSENGNVNTNLNIVRFDGYSFEKWEDIYKPYY